MDGWFEVESDMVMGIVVCSEIHSNGVEHSGNTMRMVTKPAIILWEQKYMHSNFHNNSFNIAKFL